MFNRELHEQRYQAWLKTLTPEQLEKHEAGVASAEAQIVQHDIRFQYSGKHQSRKMLCEVCGVRVHHAGVFLFGQGEVIWRVCEDHRAPCGRICLLSSEASHFGGQIMRPFADSPDCHRGRFCECQRPVKKRPRLRIPIKALKRTT